MLAKLLLTATVVAVAWIVLRARRRRADPLGAASRLAATPALVPRPIVRAVASGLLIMLLLGSGLTLYANWQQGRQVVAVLVIAPGGTVTTYESRRRDVEGRSFRTLDGRRVYVAEQERIEVAD